MFFLKPQSVTNNINEDVEINLAKNVYRYHLLTREIHFTAKDGSILKYAGNIKLEFAAMSTMNYYQV